jgi:tetratricopeptide (TPR) repeat protein
MDEINSSYEQILKQWPDDLATLQEITRINFYEWYFADAARYAERGLEYFPDDLQLRMYLAVSLENSGQSSRALHEHRINVDLFPDNENQWDNLGLYFIGVGMPDSADVAFNKALAIDSEFYPSLQGLATSAYCRGDIETAIDRINRLLKEIDLLPSSRRHVLGDMRNFGLAYFLAEAGRFGEAEGTIEEARQYATTFRETNRLERERMYLLVRLDRGEELLDLSRMVLSHKEDSLYATANGLTYRAFGLAELDSIEALSNTVEELYGWVDYAGGYLEVVITLLEARIEESKGDYADAIDRLSHLASARLCPNMSLIVDVMDEIARLQEASGDLDAAIAQHEEILRVYGGHALSHYSLGRLYEKTGDSEDARQHYERFLEMWKHADEGLPQPEYARERLNALKAI